MKTATEMGTQTKLQRVEELAYSVGAELLPYFSRVAHEVKADGSWLTEADTLAHQRLTKALKEIIDYPVLSEELTAVEQQNIIANAKAGYWCIDPLDGTTNFTQGVPYWCLSIALIENAQVSMAVVYDPNRKECFSTESDKVSCLNGVAISPSSVAQLSQAMGLIDFKRVPPDIATTLVSNPPYRSQRSYGASALDFCWIAVGRCQLYLHGRQRLWDYSGGAKILLNAQGGCETFDGMPLFQNDLEEKTVLAASNQELMSQWRAYFMGIQT